MILTAIALIFFIVLTLYDEFVSWRDVRSGFPHIDTLRSLTGICDKNELVKHFGLPDKGQRFPTTPAMVVSARSNIKLLLDWWPQDIFLISALVYAIWHGGNTGWLLVIVAGIYMLIGWFWVLFNMWKYRLQLMSEAEISSIEKLKCETKEK
jgi:hypothetical protein